MTNRTYLDNAASTPPHPELIAGFAESAAFFANPAAAHAYDLRKELGRCERELLAALRIPQDEARVIWTSGGTEANNLAIFGSRPTSVATVATEHPSVLEPAKRLGATVLPVDNEGRLSKVVAADLISVCHVHNETGVVQDLASVRAEAPASRLHVDATQSAAKLRIPWREARIDLLTCSGHKLHGFGSIGALIVRKGLSLVPQLLGGGQQDTLRSGSIDVCAVRNFARAATLTAAAEPPTLLCELRNRLDELGVPLRINSPNDASPYILNFSLPGHEGAVLVRMLAELGVRVGTGSACSAEAKAPNRTLSAMGRNRAEAFGALRVSIGLRNTTQDIHAFLAALQNVLADY
jgi:cysteine desulfurase